MEDNERILNIDNELSIISKRLDTISTKDGNLKLIKVPNEEDTNIIYSLNSSDSITKEKELIPNDFDEYFMKDIMFPDDNNILWAIKPREIRFFETEEIKKEITETL